MNSYYNKYKSNLITTTEPDIQQMASKLTTANLTTFPPISCILAMDELNGIGKNGKLPWNVPSDMEYFACVTESYCIYEAANVVVMGKNTWESIPKKYRPLSNRINIIISSTTEKNYENLQDLLPKNKNAQTLTKEIFVKDLESVFDIIKELMNMVNIEEIFFIGGKKIYDFVFDNPHIVTNKLHITHIKGTYDTDTKVNFNKYFFEKIAQRNLKCENGHISIYKPKKNLEEIAYLNMLKNIILNGHKRKTRNGNTLSCFSTTLSFDLEKSFPLITTKKMFLRGIFEELKFFLIGQTNTKILEEKNVNIWKPNTTREFLDSVGLNHLEEGDMGPLYGFQLRHYGAEYKGCNHDYTNSGYDQFQNVLNLLKTDKYSRRIMMTTFNPAQISQGPLPPCHGICIQFGIEGTNKLSCHMYQRSADTFLGIPFNISSYALLVYIICELVNNDPTYTDEKLIPGTLTMSLGDYHIYEEHIDAVKEQINRIPYLFPQLTINKKISKIEDLNFEDISIENYKSHQSLKAKMIA